MKKDKLSTSLVAKFMSKIAEQDVKIKELDAKMKEKDADGLTFAPSKEEKVVEPSQGPI